ncbi:TetR/AcrR family transcriptional regulator [Allosalinactinospora lopnorensis]|uniref:TetR/AcrR family transcriptional regulator n=1 Tax=Allosalinactinospora lopnorensis TaxID=1352348 RepID=UPI000623D5D5|nr:TetR/AcrR family transcriptional regulator [Allosalinactinospora lopnorensis]
MVWTDPPATASAEDERDQRAERILDAAAELLIAWGYRRVTIDEVARRAGVGKGTVYLHFHTKEALFLTVVMRSQAFWGTRIVQDMRADPAGVLLSRIARTSFLAMHEDAVIRAVVTGDTDTLGTLVRSASDIIGDLVRERERTVESHLQELRDHGLLRTDLPLAMQRYSYSAVVTGFLVFDPMTPHETHDTRAKADALAQTVRAAFELDAGHEALRAAAPRIIEFYQRLMDRIREEIHRQKLT